MRLWVGVFVLFGLLSAVSLAFALTLEVRLREEVVVFQETLTLGDIAEVLYPDPRWEKVLRGLSLGALPSQGERVISPQEIYARVVRQGVPGLDYIYFSGASVSRVRRGGVPVVRETLEDEIRKALQERFPEAERIEVTLLEESGITLPTPEFTVVLPETLKPWGVQGADIVAEDGTQRKTVRFALSIYRPVVRARKDLTARATIGPEDVAVSVEPVSFATEKACTALEEVLGKPVRKTIRAGDPVVPTALGKDVLIKRGDLVTMVAEYGGIVVTTTGKARGEGTLGDRIVVENTSSRKRVEGIVVDERTVRVVVQ
ncbi:flagellar basal body P-ring formation chaperone FlgA [Candidatus Caldatribacterium sp. SIUC1]|uniref:flagellar basal body P-ring formation chaperone FlgA n=1 Tax=Candidatus Caldatribacterium sp. SIUC1 TaxID=3418365 RepID=UPI003F691B72